MVAEFIFFASPVFVAIFNARLHQPDENGRRSGLASFYKTVAVLALLNFLYFCYSLFTYYPSCGSGRHACSLWRDATVNVPSQLRFWDFFFTSCLVWGFFLREQSRNKQAPNAWQFIAYSIVGSTAFALASNFAARLAMHDDIASRQQEAREMIAKLGGDSEGPGAMPLQSQSQLPLQSQQAQAQAQAQSQAQAQGLSQPSFYRNSPSRLQPSTKALSSSAGFSSGALALVTSGQRRALDPKERASVESKWHHEVSANSMAIMGYGAVAVVSLTVWVPNISSVLTNYLDFYSNYCNKFIANALLLMWTSLATRIIPLDEFSVLRVVFLVTPLFSVSTGFALFLLSREITRDRLNRDVFQRILKDGVDMASDSVLLYGTPLNDFSIGTYSSLAFSSNFRSAAASAAASSASGTSGAPSSSPSSAGGAASNANANAPREPLRDTPPRRSMLSSPIRHSMPTPTSKPVSPTQSTTHAGIGLGLGDDDDEEQQAANVLGSNRPEPTESKQGPPRSTSSPRTPKRTPKQ